MVKLIAFLVGAVFCVALLYGAVVPRDPVPVDLVAKYHLPPRDVEWQNDNPGGLAIFGTFDRAQLQRGYQVYKEICSGCHSLHRVAFRNLMDLGFSAAQVKALAKQSDVASIDDKTGDPNTRKGIPADKIPGPYANEAAARAANNNALPPDLSLITKAREEGPRYVYSLLTGFTHPVPPDWKVPDGLYYNPYFPVVERRHAAAAVGRRADHLRRRDQVDRPAERQGRRRLPDMDRRAEPRGAATHGRRGGRVPDHPVGARVSQLPAGLGRPQAQAAGEARAGGVNAMSAANDDLAALIRTVPDYPHAGILFRDITTLLLDGPGFALAIDRLADAVGTDFDLIAGIEARGFVFGAALAARLAKGLVLVRKKNKLPGTVIGVNYALEYGEDRLEIHADAVPAGARVLVVDDLIATGGTALAAVQLLRAAKAEVTAAAFVIDLPDLGGAAKLRAARVKVTTLVSFAGE